MFASYILFNRNIELKSQFLKILFSNKPIVSGVHNTIIVRLTYIYFILLYIIGLIIYNYI